jgi:P pilus assembly chaperone PapD
MILAVWLWSFSVSAVVNVDKTRVIFNQSDQAQSINLINSGESTTLLQLWTDEGDMTLSPDASITPVVVLPPVIKMFPGEIRSIRLLLTSRQSLPADKESLYWLNIYQIPALKKEVNVAERKVILPLRIRMKIFVRPAGLKAPQATDPEKLLFKKTGNTLSITNPTTWYMSMNVNTGGQSWIRNISLPPLSTAQINNAGQQKAGDTIIYEVMNDQGFPVNYRARIGE